MSYITTWEATTYCDLSDSSLAQVLIDSAESIINSFCWVDTLWETSRTEYLESKDGVTFVLSYHNPHGTIKVDGTTLTLNTNCEIHGRILTLKDYVSPPLSFPYKNKIEYMSGYATIPNAIKSAMYQIVGALESWRRNSGITEFRQDALTVKFGSNEGLSSLMGKESSSLVFSLLSKYKLAFVKSV